MMYERCEGCDDAFFPVVSRFPLCAKCAAARIAELEAADPKSIVKAQAEDEGLWFHATTVSEAHLQKELRRLHAAIERKN